MRATFQAVKGFASYSVERVRKGAEFEMEGYVMKVGSEHRCCYAVGENWIYWLDGDSSTGREWIEFDDKNDLLIAGLQYSATTGTFV